MTNRFKAEPLSNIDICNLAKQLREILNISADSYINIVAVLEIALPQLIDNFNYSIREAYEMEVSNVHAYTDHNNTEIVIRDDVYQLAVQGRGRDRLTVAHEIGHLLFHNNIFLKLSRTFSGEKIKPYEDPEWQATAFAGELLCPASIAKDMSAEAAAEKYGVSLDSAKIQKRKGEKQ